MTTKWNLFILPLFACFSLLSAPPPSPDGLQIQQFTIHVDEPGIGVDIALKNVSGNSIQFDQNGVFVGCRKGIQNCDFGHTSRNGTLAAGGTVHVHAKLGVNPPEASFTLWPAYHLNGHYGPFKWQARTVKAPGFGDRKKKPPGGTD